MDLDKILKVYIGLLKVTIKRDISTDFLRFGYSLVALDYGAMCREIYRIQTALCRITELPFDRFLKV